MDLTEIEAFFRDKAYAYTQGRLRYLSLLFDTPTTFSIGTQKLQLETAREVERLFQTYRQNLVAKGYQKTVAEVLHCERTDQEGFRCLVTYRNVGREDGIISREHGSYFLNRTNEGFLRISFVEFLDEPKAELLPKDAFDRNSCSSD